jgi:hypothetical protein
MDMDFWMSNAVLTIPIGIGLRMAAGRNEWFSEITSSEWPLINSEWHLCHGAVAKDKAYLQR